MDSKDPREHVEGISGTEFSEEFLDETGAEVDTKQVRCGRGRVKGTSRGPWSRGLQSEVLSAPGGRLGWRVKLPGSRPLPTPAVADGRVYIGGGFGSYEFYCFHSEDGRFSWRLKTEDDGPTAATVAGDCVAFNTESCTVYVVDGVTGHVRWSKWLGDPLMAHTAVSGSTLFMVYPDQKYAHHLAAFELRTGKRKWQTELKADVITAPIVAEGSVYAATLDGTVYRIDKDSGKAEWSVQHRATSAPWVHRGRVYMSLREDVKGADWHGGSAEGLNTADVKDGVQQLRTHVSRRKARYLAYRARLESAYAAQDESVGFGAKPAAAKMEYARAHLGKGNVASVWSFQGSRPEVFDDGIFCVLDDVVQRLELGTKNPLWRIRATSGKGESSDRLLSPPAVTSSHLYLSSRLGDLFVLDRESGEEVWALNVGSPVLSQPAVAEGKVFLGTADGFVYAFETEEQDDSSVWPMWGGGPGHNGP